MRVALKFISIGLTLCSGALVYMIIATLSNVKYVIDDFRENYGEDFLIFAEEEQTITTYVFALFGVLLLTTICLLVLRTSVERDQTNDQKKFEIEDEQIVGETDEERNAKAMTYAESYLEFVHETDHKVLAEMVLTKLASDFQVVAATLYRKIKGGNSSFSVLASYAHVVEDEHKEFALGEGLIGQVAQEVKPMLIDEIPENYIQVFSGLGSAQPTALLLLPLASHGMSKGVIELAFFRAPNKTETAKIEAALSTIESIFSGKAVPKES